MSPTSQGTLHLEHGSAYAGTFLVPPGPEGISGELVFNTSMTGYQEIITDPSYCNQIIVFSYPLIGNYGASEDANECATVAAAGVVVNGMEKDDTPGSLLHFLKKMNVPVLSGIDTRKLVREIREKGTVPAWLLCEPEARGIRSDTDSGAKTVPWKTKRGTEALSVSCSEKRETGSGKRHVAVIDFGCKKSIVSSLVSSGHRVTVFPCGTKAAEIAAAHPDGLVLSNGPGDPKDVLSLVSDIPHLFGEIPVMGICLGHQLLALLMGCDTERLKYGHRGANHAVIETRTGKVFITSQNHGYTVVGGSIPSDVRVSMRNLNDNSIEGIESRRYPIFSVQFHPEAHPGPRESGRLFERFDAMMREGAIHETA